MSDVIRPLFTEVLLISSSQGLIGGKMFPIDGCKLPSNASKEHSGTHAELAKKQKKINQADDACWTNTAKRIAWGKTIPKALRGAGSGHTRRAAEETNIDVLRKASHKIKAEDFTYDPTTLTCRGPAGNDRGSGGTRVIEGNTCHSFTGYLNKCRDCPLLKQCIPKPIKDQGRQVSIKLTTDSATTLTDIGRMKIKIDSNSGQHNYSRRLGAVEPVFGNFNTTKRLYRFPPLFVCLD